MGCGRLVSRGTRRRSRRSRRRFDWNRDARVSRQSAAAGLKLQRYRVAADDAACAIERDSNLKALIRGGTANLRLRCADKALKMFDAALAVAPEDERALREQREAARRR